MKQANKIMLREREVRSIHAELDRWYSAKWDLGEYKLSKPIKNGWYKHLTLRDDVARRKDAYIFQNVLDIAGIWIWGRDKKHADKAGVGCLEHC